MLHTFVPGTVARASQVNENFDYVNYGNLIVKDGNEQELGTSIGVDHTSQSVSFLNSNGYIMHVRFETGNITSKTIYYTTNNCTGTPYTRSGNGFVFRNSYSGDLYYTEKTANPQNITLNSWGNPGSCSSTNLTTQSYEANSNNSTITGVSSPSFTLPLTIERR